MERRVALESALSGLRLSNPAVPQHRDFQAASGPFHTSYSSDGHLRERSGYWSPCSPCCLPPGVECKIALIDTRVS